MHPPPPIPTVFFNQNLEMMKTYKLSLLRHKIRVKVPINSIYSAQGRVSWYDVSFSLSLWEKTRLPVKWLWPYWYSLNARFIHDDWPIFYWNKMEISLLIAPCLTYHGSNEGPLTYFIPRVVVYANTCCCGQILYS